MSSQQTKHVFVVSDSTGETAHHLLQTLLAQFDSSQVRIHRYADVITPQQIQEILDEVLAADGLVIHTLVIPGLREAMVYLSRQRQIPCIDVMGKMLENLGLWLGQQPRYEAGRTRKLDDSYSRRVLALEFALRHDDGQNASGLPQADAVLVGVSRTGKTPLCVYLAYRGILVGNIPIVEGVDPPSVLFDLPPERVYALTMSPDRLVLLRHQRNQRLGISGGYDDLEVVRLEIRQALRLYAEAGWQVVDTTYRTIEEIAEDLMSQVVQLRGTR
jgi:[pyruvate, water dikinase]-phosphate phosphotransferase / [pyruvate, water dikinase] kinase